MIAHLDADSFFASVLIRCHPELRGKPLLAVGMGGGCVIAATYEAKAKGVKTGMRLRDARLLVPDAVEMPADFRETGIASEQIEAILRDECPVLQQMSIDEWFLDLAALVGGIPKDPQLWAISMREKILQHTDLSMSVGVAPSKLLAKMASEYRKPGGITLVRRDAPAGRLYKEGSELCIETFLKDRPAAAIPGIGRQRTIKTDAEGWLTAWDIAKAPDAALIRVCGRPGTDMKRELLGEPLSAVSADIVPPQSISRCRTFRMTSDPAMLKAHLLKHAEYCTMKMRRWNFACRDVSIHLRDADFHYQGAHRRLLEPASTATPIVQTALELLQALTNDARGKRFGQVGLALHGFSLSSDRQPTLFENPKEIEADEELQKALDSLHVQFGRDSVTRGAALAVKSGTRQDLNFMLIE